MFDAILNGKTIEEALVIKQTFEAEHNDDDIELF